MLPEAQIVQKKIFWNTADWSKVYTTKSAAVEHYVCYECYLYQGNKDSADADNPHGDDEKDTEVEMHWDIFLLQS